MWYNQEEEHLFRKEGDVQELFEEVGAKWKNLNPYRKQVSVGDVAGH
jgi:hypothetical protein